MSVLTLGIFWYTYDNLLDNECSATMTARHCACSSLPAHHVSIALILHTLIIYERIIYAYLVYALHPCLHHVIVMNSEAAAVHS
jgi:hypothetical protein